MDGGTLYQLRNVINRRNVVQHPKDNMNAYEEFFLLVAEAHILSAAMTTFEMSSATDIPSNTFSKRIHTSLPLQNNVQYYYKPHN